MKTIVMKFGGSSLGDPDRIRLAAARVRAARRRGAMPVVVVSAPADCTDDLIKLAARTGPVNPSPREMDALLASGEQFSAALMALALAAAGTKAVSLTGFQAGIRTDAVFSAAGVRGLNPARLKKEIAAGNIPVVAGFQGSSPAGDITTLGRGGSDLTAVLIAAALRSELCEFYTDVKGIYTAHPAIVPEARRMPAVSYAEIIALAGLGTEVRQLRAVVYAARRGLKLSLRSSFHDEPGTIVTASGRPGMNCLSIKKEGAIALVSAIGCRLGGSHIKKVLAAAAGFGAEKARASGTAITLRVKAAQGDALLKALHAALIA